MSEPMMTATEFMKQYQGPHSWNRGLIGQVALHAKKLTAEAGLDPATRTQGRGKKAREITVYRLEILKQAWIQVRS